MAETQATDPDLTQEGAAAPQPGTPGADRGEQPPEKTDESPTVTMSQRELDVIIGKRLEAERQEKQALEARVRTLEARPVQPTGTVTQPMPTPDQVLSAYDKGQITEIQKDQWMFYFAKESAKQEFGQTITHVALATKAQAVVGEYVQAMPSLANTTSQEFRSLAQTYNELLAEGQPDGLTTQAKALRMTFGPLKRLAEPSNNPTPRADTFVEGTGSGGQMTRDNDPLKDVPERQKAYWKSKGYTKAQMTQEATLSGVRSITDYRRIAPKPKKP